jgi:hypothetical protein
MSLVAKLVGAVNVKAAGKREVKLVEEKSQDPARTL